PAQSDSSKPSWWGDLSGCTQSVWIAAGPTTWQRIMPEADSKMNPVIGVDLGGTKILAGVFDASLECIGIAKVSTKAQRGTDAVIDRIARCVNEAVDEADLTLKQIGGIGIGAPGPVDRDTGSVITAPNLPGW